MNPCPIPGCTGKTMAGHLLCLFHWRTVPTKLKSEVWTTFRAIRHRTGKKAAEVRADVETYRKARDAAIAAVTAQECPLLPADDQNPSTAGVTET